MLCHHLDDNTRVPCGILRRCGQSTTATVAGVYFGFGVAATHDHDSGTALLGE
jgi:hypothetical protein